MRLERLIEDSREVTFYGWNGMQHNEGAHFRLTFQKEGKVKLDTLGYNFVGAYGSYRLEKGALIQIAFTGIDAPKSDKTGYTTDWPVLRLSELDGRFLIHRADGSAAWHLGWPLYPQIMGDLWPASTAMERADQDGADQPAPAPELKPEDKRNSKPESEGRIP